MPTVYATLRDANITKSSSTRALTGFEQHKSMIVRFSERGHEVFVQISSLQQFERPDCADHHERGPASHSATKLPSFDVR